jgi:hypothetical protein
MNTLLPYMIAAHCIGDGILQNNWMQAKRHNSWVCTWHVLTYLIPFSWLLGLGMHWWLLLLIGAEHWLQDRFGLHMWWMRFYHQSNAQQWPVGPLYVDQCWHIAFIAAFSLLT